MADYLGLRCTYMDSTETGGSSYLVPPRPRRRRHRGGQGATSPSSPWPASPAPAARRPAAAAGSPTAPEAGFEQLWGMVVVNGYAMAAARHMYEFGTTCEQLAEIKVAASTHAQHNPHALLRDVVSVEEVVGSPLVADPLHRLDCCVITDGGGAVVVVSPEVAASLDRTLRQGAGPGRGGQAQRQRPASTSPTPAAVWSGPRAFAEAGVTPADIDYVSIYDSFTITVLQTLEDLGFCEKGKGGRVRGRRRRCSRPTAGCRSTPTAAGCATTTPATGAA